MNGYIALEINGEKVGIKFGLRAVVNYMEQVNSNPLIVDSVSKLPNEIGYSWLVFYGYQNNCLLKGEQPSKTFEFFSDFIEGCFLSTEGIETIKSIGEAFESSIVVKQLTPTDDDDPLIKKKKSTPKKSKASVTGS